MSRILLWSPNYAPEYMGIPPLVTDAAEWLTERGHHVDVVTAMPNYPTRVIRPEYRGRFWMHERCREVSIHRSWLRVRPQGRVRDELCTCASCGRSYSVFDGIPVLVAAADGEHAAGQARWFDDEVDAEWEIERPQGSPQFHRWLLAEKFRRGVNGNALSGVTALSVCGGSGMDAEFLARAGARVISSDISLGAARRALERGRRHGVAIDAIVADAERLPFPDGSIDIVYVHDGLHHLEQPLSGLAEMARVAKRAVCVTEPARAAVTDLAVRLGLALEHEEAGNRVARLTLDDVRSTLTARGFHIVAAERYGMYYRHEPGRTVRLLSHQPLLGVAQASFRLANALGGSLGNKLTVQGVGDPA